MRICPGCRIEKSNDDFYTDRSHKSGLTTYCKECERERAATRFRQRKEKDPEAVRLQWRALALERRIFLYDYLSGHPCVDCGEMDPMVLDFDHVKGEKSFNVSSAASGRISWKRIQEEIEKCEIRCACCHRRKTAKEYGWYSWLTDR